MYLGSQHCVAHVPTGVSLTRHWTKPGPVVREATVILQGAPSFNFDGDPIQRALFFNTFGTLHNFWSFNTFMGYNFSGVVDDRLTRGGPSALAPANSSPGGVLQR